jgi:hypothetical protein
MTLLLLWWNYHQVCGPQSITIDVCFYLPFDWMQVVHVFVANTLLFTTHLYFKISSNEFDLSKYNIKTSLAAPLLE